MSQALLNMEFMESIREGDVKKVRDMLKKGNINVNFQDGRKCTPLILAADVGSEKIVSLLLKHKVRTELTDQFGYTALEIAENNGYYKIARMLERAEFQRKNDLQISQKCANMIIKKSNMMKPFTKLCLLNGLFKMMTAEDQERTFSAIRGSISKGEAARLLRTIRKNKTQTEEY